MNQRAFNLFTALISFILIILSSLLVQSMIQSERTTSTIITNVESASKLRSVAELARADAIQLLNFGMRSSIEGYITSNPYTIDFGKKTWAEIQTDYASFYFGSGKHVQFAEYASNKLFGLFYSVQSFGNYSVQIGYSKDGGNVGETMNAFSGTIAKLVENSVKESDFFKVVGCDEGNPFNCPQGTFYINLKVQSLTDEEYESLPRIYVTDKATGDKIQVSIFPKSNFRIFVPIRLFKAIAIARAAAHYPIEDARSGNFSENNFNSSQDYGLLSPRIHNEFQEIGLGFCDKDYCNARKNPFIAPDQKVAGQGCPSDSKSTAENRLSRVELQCIGALVERGMCNSAGENFSYNPDDKTSQESALQKLVKRRVCHLIQKNDAVKSRDDFELIQDSANRSSLPDVPCDKIDLLNVAINSSSSKKIIHRDGTSNDAIAGFSANYTANNPVDSGARCPFTENGPAGVEKKIGYYSEDGKINAPAIDKAALACTDSGESADGWSTCSAVSQIEIHLAFKENNSNYKVIKNKTSIIRINVLDNTFAGFNPKYDSAGVLPNCSLEGKPVAAACSYAEGNGWFCHSDSGACRPG